LCENARLNEEEILVRSSLKPLPTSLFVQCYDQEARIKAKFALGTDLCPKPRLLVLGHNFGFKDKTFFLLPTCKCAFLDWTWAKEKRGSLYESQA